MADTKVPVLLPAAVVPSKYTICLDVDLVSHWSPGFAIANTCTQADT